MGKIYNWFAVNDSRGLAPAGWHIPTQTEMTTLVNTLGGAATAGGKMKTAGTTYCSTNTSGTNSSGFSGLLGGNRNNYGPFYFIGYSGSWWSSTEYDTYNAWLRHLNYYNGNVDSYNVNKAFGFSVRCLRD